MVFPLDLSRYAPKIAPNMAEIIKLSESALDKNRGSTDNALASLHAHFADDMKAVEAKITTHLAAASTLIPDIATHIISAGGKRLRPLLTLSAARLCDYGGDYSGTHHITLATAVEFMHTATLLHDDVVDDSDLRRGLPTARKVWGNPASVLVGDFLLGQAFRMMVEAKSLPALAILSDAAAIIAEGEVMQLAAMAEPHISEDNYLRIIEAKTAALFASAAEVGGVIADARPATREALKAFGRNLGIAFQLVDDALDYGSVGQVLGKNTGEDFREGKITLPLILAYHRGTADDRIFLERVSKDNKGAQDFKQAVALMHSTNALQDTLVRASHYGEKAKDALGMFKQHETHALLTLLVDFCIRRAY